MDNPSLPQNPSDISGLLQKFVAARGPLEAKIAERQAAGQPVAAGQFRLQQVDSRIAWLQSVLAAPNVVDENAVKEIVTVTAVDELKWAEEYVKGGAEAAELKTLKEFEEGADFSQSPPR